VLTPNEQKVGTLNGDFAFESMPGDVFQLGNTQYRIQKVEQGKVYVADAQGAPPTIPFWLGEGLGRTDELSASVGRLNDTLADLLDDGGPRAAVDWLTAELGLAQSAAEQIVEYLGAAKAALGALPSGKRVIFERFFDETGDTHLVIHSPFGSRVNRAWGLALRKRFCRRFNFELQAAALEDSIVISLGAVQLRARRVARYLTRHRSRRAHPSRPDAPLRRVLALERHGRALRAPLSATTRAAQFQRNGGGLLSTVFPHQLACRSLAGRPRDPTIRSSPRRSPIASRPRWTSTVARRCRADRERRSGVLCHDSRAVAARAESSAETLRVPGRRPPRRRTLADEARHFMTPEQASELGKLDPEAIERVRYEAWPQARNADELYDALVTVGFVTVAEAAREWTPLIAELEADGRATRVDVPGVGEIWVGAERLTEITLALPRAIVARRLAALDGDAKDPDAALRELVRSRLEALGPVTAERSRGRSA
jgi:ATP-dependent Lhr-like helicase